MRTNQAVEYKKYAELLERATELESRLATLEQQSQQPFAAHDEVVVLARSGRITWSELFLAVASSILESAMEDDIIAQLKKTIFAGGLPPEANLEVSTVRERLFALNLIDVSTLTRTDSQGHMRSRSATAWKLTDYGRKQFALLHYSK